MSPLPANLGIPTLVLTPAEQALLAELEWLRQHPPHVLIVRTNVDFDQDPSGNPIANGTMLDVVQPYASVGVTFSANLGGPSGGHVFARSLSTAETPPNVVSLYGAPTLPYFNATLGAVRATFSQPQNTVAIDVQPVIASENGFCTQNKPYLVAIDANGNYFGETFYATPYCDQNGQQDPLWGTWQTMQIAQATATIAAVEFSVQQGHGVNVYAVFDHLRCTSIIT